jgi:GNAT superfamily N-acetyltransferase
LRVRLAGPADLPAAGALSADYFDAVPDSYREVLRDAAGRAAAGDVFVAVAADTAHRGERVVGTASLFTPQAGPDYAERAGDGEALLRMVVVHPDARGLGVGTALTEAAMHRARALGCQRLLLSVEPWRHGARRVYERLGFRRTSHDDWSPHPGVELLAYAVEL